MTGMEFGLGILVGLIVIILIVSVITIVVTKINYNEINNIRNVYLGKLSNTDTSIQDAMKYLKLTNGIKQQFNNGEKK